MSRKGCECSVTSDDESVINQEDKGVKVCSEPT